MRHARMRHQHVIDEVREVLEVAEHRLQDIVRIACERISLLNLIDAIDQRTEFLRIVGRMGGERNVDERSN